MLLNDFVDEYGKARSRAADLQRAAGKRPGDQAPDDSCNEAGGGRNPGRDRDPHTEGKRDQKNDYRREKILLDVDE